MTTETSALCTQMVTNHSQLYIWAINLLRSNQTDISTESLPTKPHFTLINPFNRIRGLVPN